MQTDYAQILPVILPVPKAGPSAPANGVSADGKTASAPGVENVDLDAANLTELEKKASIVQRLIFSGYDPAAILEFLGLPDITHTGVPSTQLQPISQIDPEDPKAAYEVGA